MKEKIKFFIIAFIMSASTLIFIVLFNMFLTFILGLIAAMGVWVISFTIICALLTIFIYNIIKDDY